MSRKKKRAAAAAPAGPAAPAPARRGRGPLLAAVVAAALGLAAFLGLRRGTVPPTVAHPNVLLITVDTLRADRLGAYGYGAAATPHIDALAAAGARFPSALTHAPLTLPAHASLLTGLTPPRHGARDNGQALPAGVPTLAESFRAAGYATGAFVSGFPLDHRFGLARGFDEYDDRLPRGDDPRRASYVERPGPDTTAAALRWIDARPAGRPWFAWIHYFEPHAPYDPPPSLRAAFASRPYDGEVAAVDVQVGAVLQRLQEAGRRAGTLVLLTADHGESLGEHGEDTHGVFVYEATLRVPLIVAGPGVPAGRAPAATARGIDAAPTLLDLAGLPALAEAEGRSLKPALDGAAPRDEPAYGESLFTRLNLGWAPLHAWRRGQWKLVEAPRPELYDVVTDPGETHDLAAQQPAVLERLRRELAASLAAAQPVAVRAASSPPGVDTEAARQLAALGYLSGGPAGAAASGRNPRDGIALVNRLERAIAEARTRPDWAAQELGALLREDPGLTLGRRYRAIALSTAGQNEAAVRELELLEKAVPAGADDLTLRAECLRLAGRPGEALAALDRALRLAPGSTDAQLTRALVLKTMGRLDEAAAVYQGLLAANQQSGPALRGLGDAALARGDVAAAEGYFTRVLQQEPGDAGARVKMGLVLVRSGRLEAALAAFGQAVEADPSSAEALLALAGALAKSGRAPEAVPYFERALAAGARSPAALNGLGFARLEAGDAHGALESLRASLALEPRQPEVAQMAARLAGDASGPGPR